MIVSQYFCLKVLAEMLKLFYNILFSNIKICIELFGESELRTTVN